MLSYVIIAAIILFGSTALNVSILFDPRVWIFYLCMLVVIYSHPKTETEKKDDKDKLSLHIITLGIFLSFLPVYFLFLKASIFKTPLSSFTLTEIIGALMAILGTTIRWVSIKTLGNWFTSKVIIQDKQELVNEGFYKYLRHPSYTGALLFWLSPPFIFNLPFTVFFTFPILFSVYLRRIKVEEFALEEKFGDQYRKYCRSTYRLLPLIY